MWYFTYDLGEFYVNREFNDAYDVEIVDIVPFYDIERIKNWCHYADIAFPYEQNDCVNRILSKIDMEYEGFVGYDYSVLSFHIHVTNGDIKLYCEERKKWK